MKFVTLTNHRSGSSHFQRLLDSHPDILARQEDFREEKSTQTPEQIIESLNNIYKNDGKYKAVSFKLMYSHLQRHGNNKVFTDYFKEHDVKVVQLIRRNLLEMAIWYSKHFEDYNTNVLNKGLGVPVYIKGGTAKVIVKRVVSQMAETRDNIHKYKHLADFRLYYEDDLVGWDNEGQDFYNQETKTNLLNFLGVDPTIPLTSPHKKNVYGKTEEVIENYDELLNGVKRMNLPTILELI